MSSPEFSYGQARLQARHGAMPDAAAWQLLEASRTADHYLGLARSGPLARWIGGIDRIDGADGLSAADMAHRVEDHLRSLWTGYVDDVVRWQPQRWQAALRWFGSLPELPLRAEPALAGQAARWLATWQGLLPPGDRRSAALLRRVAALLMPGLQAGPVVGATRGAAVEPARRALTLLFRHHGSSPVAAFAHLALVALDLERLRGGLVTRVLLPPEPAAEGAPSAAPGRVPQEA